ALSLGGGVSRGGVSADVGARGGARRRRVSAGALPQDGGARVDGAGGAGAVRRRRGRHSRAGAVVRTARALRRAGAILLLGGAGDARPGARRFERAEETLAAAPGER